MTSVVYHVQRIYIHQDITAAEFTVCVDADSPFRQVERRKKNETIPSLSCLFLGVESGRSSESKITTTHPTWPAYSCVSLRFSNGS